ncbi:hypothetical protein [Patulibacter defluvii]|uniref:hypothetical protein n=1 Tax=Patulibacter defluvii TaxID=3095358 RepID=UPI002A74D654|nr:hypothetical protein [Patulibacter sp. DM4]
MARRSIVVLSAGLAVAGLSACGRIDPKDKPSGSRPPAQILLTAAITDRGVDLSRGKVGGGPVRIVISNQTKRNLRTTLVGRDGDRRGTNAIAPGQVAAIQATLQPDSTYRLRTAGSDPVRPAVLRVGGQRKSSDDELLLP